MRHLFAIAALACFGCDGGHEWAGSVTYRNEAGQYVSQVGEWSQGACEDALQRRIKQIEHRIELTGAGAIVSWKDCERRNR